jgi:hypothetical protein
MSVTHLGKPQTPQHPNGGRPEWMVPEDDSCDAGDISDYIPHASESGRLATLTLCSTNWQASSDSYRRISSISFFFFTLLFVSNNFFTLYSVCLLLQNIP